MSDAKLIDAPSVVITGASTGIGEACALEMDRRNWRVFAGVRSAEAGQRLRQQASARLVPLLIDVTDRGQIAAAANSVADAVGPAGLAGLVNNAGIVVAGPVELIPLEDLRKEFEVNVVGQVAVTQAFLPQVRAARGRIVLMSSISGRVASPYLGPYAASKHALEAIGDSLRVELRRWGIAVSLIEPGSIRTPIWGKALAEADRLAERMPPAAETLYGEEIEQMRRATALLAANGLPVETVVRAVVHALTSPRPKTRYPVGAQTKLAVGAFKCLSDRTKDWFVRRALGLP
jgi:NAD(P)-dependent dehydrogenase (short-subunit alcohol dehydrogenase family)